MAHNLVLGGWGFLGAALCRELLARGEDVIVFDAGPAPQTAADLAPRVSYIPGDVTESASVAAAVADLGPENIFCLPAIMPPASEQAPALAYQLNIQGTFNVLEACRAHPPKCLLMVSSISVYEPGAPPVVADDFPQRPQSMYGVSKVCTEQLGELYARRYGVNFRALRFPGILGPGRQGKAQTLFACYAINSAVAGRPYTLNITPETALVMVYIKDAVRAFLRLRDAPQANLTRRVYNINGFFFSAAELISAIQRVKPGSRFDYQPEENVVSVIRGWPHGLEEKNATRDWGWQPEYELETAVADYIADLSAHPHRYPPL
jgi:threonine 3-dehydrogenase